MEGLIPSSTLAVECDKAKHKLTEQRQLLDQAQNSSRDAQDAERAATTAWQALPSLETEEEAASANAETLGLEEVQSQENEYKVELEVAARSFLSEEEAREMQGLMPDYFLELLNGRAA